MAAFGPRQLGLRPRPHIAIGARPLCLPLCTSLLLALEVFLELLSLECDLLNKSSYEDTVDTFSVAKSSTVKS